MITPSLLVETFKSVNHLTVYRKDAVLLGMVWTVEIMGFATSNMSQPTNLEESFQSSGQLLHTLLQVVYNGPIESFSFAVESLVRTFDLEPADAFVNEVMGKEVLGDSVLLEIFGELGVGDALSQWANL